MPRRIMPSPSRTAYRRFAVLAARHVVLVAVALAPHNVLSQPATASPLYSPAVGITADTQAVATWAVSARDAGGLPFVVVDKRRATVTAFDASGRFLGSTAVLLGLARGDDSVPGIGDRKIADIRPHERTTPAGRFVAELGTNSNGEDILWVDYDAAISMHRVRPVAASQRRIERLASPTPDDNRISYGCINVPAAFYDETVKPLFAPRNGIVYVLPDSKPLASVFSAAVAARSGH